MTPEPQVGDLIDIAIKGARVTDVSPFGFVRAALTNQHGQEEGIGFGLKHPALAFEIVKPAQHAAWPPQEGDLWIDDDGDVWFAVDISPTSKPEIKLVPSFDANGYDPERVREDMGSLDLVRRKYDDQ